MQNYRGSRLYSAGDLVAHLECAHATTLALQDLEAPLARAEDDGLLELIQQKGFAHEDWYLKSIKTPVFELPSDGAPDELAARTLAAMREGHDVIFQAALLSGPFYGRADFLRRVEQPSALGAWRYEPVDTKLARTPKAKFLSQLSFYSDLLTEVQGAEARSMHLVLGDGAEKAYRVADFSRYHAVARERFVAFTGSHPNATAPEKNDHCPFCPWRNLCEARWDAEDHLNRVAGLTRPQADKLRAAGISTSKSLASAPASLAVPRLHPDTVAKLKAQAALQLEARAAGAPRFERLPPDPEGIRGLARLPEPDAGDVFFDMEGDPFEQGGLEYLFGLRYREGDAWNFRPLWAHDRAGERAAFEALMDFLAARLERHPGMHVYHYAHYEPAALKRLMSLHGTREAAVDELLRRGTLVDLYKVVREALRASEGYSLKDLEPFFMPPREGEVRDAGASIVHYERWRATGDAASLDAIRLYNERDCLATHGLRDWLVFPEGKERALRPSREFGFLGLLEIPPHPALLSARAADLLLE